MTKISEERAGYIQNAKYRRCITCIHYQGNNFCSVVTGKISPRGSCNYHKRR